jgi:RecG-like helicase
MEIPDAGKSKKEYIPGECNIGPEERRARRLAGKVGSGFTLVLWVVFLFTHTPQIWRLLVFLPASLAAIGFLQSAFHFCAGFGLKGVFNFGLEVGKTENIIQAEFRKKDRRQALFILGLAVLIGGAVALAAFLIRI